MRLAISGLFTAVLAGCGNDVTLSVTPNEPPQVSIVAPLDQARFTNAETVQVIATVQDVNGLADVVEVVWESSLSGLLLDGESALPDAEGTALLARTFEEGVHTLTLRATDAEGLTGSASITLNIDRAGSGPVAEISQPLDLSVSVAGEPIDLVGSVFDADQPLETVQVQWTLTGADGIPTLLANNLPTLTGLTTATWADPTPGEWELALLATDADGLVGVDAVWVTVLEVADADGDGVTIDAGDCDDTNAEVFPGAEDVPDADFLDENCDGIDGDVELAVFVATTGSDSGDCSISDPCRTVGYALSQAFTLGLRDVYVRAGTYVEVVDLVPGVDLYGGYNEAWERSTYDQPGHSTLLRGGLAADEGRYVVLRAQAGDQALVADVILEAPTASGSLGMNGRSSYAVHAVDAALVFERVEIRQGDGAPGLPGSDGASASGVAAATGGRGEDADSFEDCCDTGRRGGGGGASNPACGGTLGGTGGQGGQMDTSCGWTGCCSDCDATDGLAGGNASEFVSFAAGTGGAGGPTCNAGTAGQPGRVVNGAGGVGGPAGGVLVGADWFARAGGDGTIGLDGGGGGGGGGSGGCDAGTDDRGAGGGGGGAGGCKATNGLGGGGGGGSFGIFAVRGEVTARDVVFLRGRGGAGGPGGLGGAGQPGGLGGAGGNGTGDTGPGGNGGNGGHGGHGGGGGGGAGGASYGIYAHQAVVTQVGSAFLAGSPGGGGAAGPSAPGWPDAVPGQAGADGVLGDVGECRDPLGC